MDDEYKKCLLCGDVLEDKLGSLDYGWCRLDHGSLCHDCDMVFRACEVKPDAVQMSGDCVLIRTKPLS